MAKKIKKSVFSRSAKLLGMAAKVASKEIGSRLADKVKETNVSQKTQTRVEQAKVIAENLSQLKGAAMKAGQLLSIDTSEFLPPEAAEVLSKLQSQANPIDFEVIDKVIRLELQDEYSLLQNINPSPLAAASIGQVHEASYKGEAIVLKVQYPGVADAIDSDLRVLRQFAEKSLWFTDKKIDLVPIFSELQKVLEQEADYLYECSLLSEIKEKIQGKDPFVVPTVFPEISTERVLAMEKVNGELLSSWLKKKHSQEKLNLVGATFLDLFMKEFFDWKLVQTDPNFGNFLIQEDPFKIVLLDYGAGLKYSESFIKEYRSIIKIAAEGSADELFEAAVKMELLDVRESDEVKQAFYLMMKNSMEPFLTSSDVFVFDDINYERRTKEVGIEFINKLKFSAPPRKLIFLHRKLGGLFQLLKRMKVQLDLSNYWEVLSRS